MLSKDAEVDTYKLERDQVVKGSGRSTSCASSIEHHLGNRLIAQTVLSSTTFELQAVRMTLQVKGEFQVHRIEG